MAKTAKKEVKEYLYGTFLGKKGSLTINAETPKKDVEAFLKDNPELEGRLTDKSRITEQRKLIQDGIK